MRKVQKYLKAHNLFEKLMFKAGLQFMGMDKKELAAMESNPEFIRVLSQVEEKFPDACVEFTFVPRFWCYNMRMSRLVDYTSSPVAEFTPPEFDHNKTKNLPW
jgi:hypothetical protein